MRPADSLRRWLARKLVPSVFEEEERLFRLEQRLSDMWRWCGEFEQMCDAIKWIREPRTEIHVWREQMREKYGRPRRPYEVR